MAVDKTRIGGIVIGVNVLLAAIWWLVPLGMYGVFDDGLFYGSIARNLVYEAGDSIWDFKVSNTLDPQFNGHPPLSFWVQALFFRVLGDVYWVERVYSLFLAGWALLGLAACWRLFEPQGRRLPLLFWLSISIVGWCFGNNLLENLLTVCTITAVYLLVRQAQENRNNWLWIVLAGAFVVAAVLTKGPVGIYPLSVPVLYALTVAPSRWKRALVESVLLLVLVVGSYCLLITLSPRAALYFNNYWELQLVGSLSGKYNFAEGRLSVLRSLFEEFLPPLLSGLALLGSARYLKLPTTVISKKVVLFWFLLALAASLPLMISPKQLRFYIVPSMGWYALAWALFCWPSFLALAKYTQAWYRRRRALQVVLGVGIIGCFVLSVFNIGKNSRQEALMSDVRAIGAVVPLHSEVYIPNNIYRNWGLHGYFYRYFYIDLTTTYNKQPYAVGYKGEALDWRIYQSQLDSLEVLELYRHPTEE